MVEQSTDAVLNPSRETAELIEFVQPRSKDRERTGADAVQWCRGRDYKLCSWARGGRKGRH